MKMGQRLAGKFAVFAGLSVSLMVFGQSTAGAQPTGNADARAHAQHSSSMYEVPGAEFMELKAGVPHGAISVVSYDSSATGGQRRVHVYTPLLLPSVSME